MVRVADERSGGCRTCRRRRIKCDERHPTCAKCEKSLYTCEGYTRDHRFVDENARAERRVKKASLSESPPKGLVQVSQIELVHAPSSNAAFSSIISPSIKPTSSSQDNIYTFFLLSNLLHGIGTPSESFLPSHVRDPSPSARLSTLALSCMYFSRLHNHPTATDRARTFYIQALKSLNRDLQNPEKAWSASVLTSAIVLEFYEFMDSESPSSGWLAHAGGVGRLIELRGPWRHQEPFYRTILGGNRVTIALECLVKKKRCFLESPDWKTIPWSLQPGEKVEIEYLHDILCAIPGLVEDAEMLQLVGIDTEERRIKYEVLCQNIMDGLKMLFEWRVTWQQKNPATSFEVPTRATPESSRYLYPNVLSFSSLALANEILFYNALLFLLTRLGHQIISPRLNLTQLKSFLPTELDYTPLQAPGSTQDLLSIATEICRSIEYFLQSESRSASAFLLLFPLRLVCQAFPPESKEVEWLGKVMQEVADSSGFQISRGMGRRNWPYDGDG